MLSRSVRWSEIIKIISASFPACVFLNISLFLFCVSGECGAILSAQVRRHSSISKPAMSWAGQTRQLLSLGVCHRLGRQGGIWRVG
jgi:hypothetical protein